MFYGVEKPNAFKEGEKALEGMQAGETCHIYE